MKSTYLITTFLFLATARTTTSTRSRFCSQVHQMELQCVAEEYASRGSDPTVIEGRVGKAGVRGPPGEAGRPGIVNYTEIYGNIEKEFQDIESRLDTKLAKYESLLEEVEELKQDFRFRERQDCGSLTRDDIKTSDDKGGLADIYLRGGGTTEVYCDLTTDGGRWTVIQRRINGSVNFNRNWAEYVAGFGDKMGEFWLGLELMHQITTKGQYELRVELSDKAGRTAYAEYGIFSIAGSADNYRLTVGQYSGTAGDSMTYHNNMPFSTPDKDLDKWSNNCADYTKGAWWFNHCVHSHLNGDYAGRGNPSAGRPGIYWVHWRSSESLRTADMKIRKK